MNIFIDTSVLYKDPYWKGNFYKELLNIVREREVNLFASSVVIKELERNFGKIIDEENIKLRKVIDQVQHYKLKVSSLEQIDKVESVKELLDFYRKLEEEDVLKIIDFENDILPEIVERAIWRRKPFNETKTELKDAIIWLTYAKYIEKEKLENCVLLTENVSDFCNIEKLKQDIFEIHPDLQEDTNKFKVYKSPKELIQQEKKQLQFVNQRFDIWLKEQNFDEQFLMEMITEKFQHEIERKIERKYEDSDITSVFGDDDYYRTGYLSFNGFDFGIIEDINVDLFNEECLISGDLYVHCLVEGYEYQPAADPGEEKYKYIGSKEITVRAVFSFMYDRKEIPSQFDLDLIEMTEVS